MASVPEPSQRVSWSSLGHSFALELADGSVALRIDRERVVSLSLGEWNDVRAGLNELARRRARTTPPPPGPDRALVPNNGRPWTEELDRALCQAWYAGGGLATLAVRFGRTEGGIASRLVRLDCVNDRDEARARP